MKWIFLLSTVALVASCTNTDTTNGKTAGAATGSTSNEPTKNPVDSTNLTTIQWLDQETQDLGTLTKGQVVEVSWRFKNTGNKPLTIADVRAGCGCTTPEPPKEPIAPGGESVIKAKFDSQNFSGRVSKEVYVQANNSNRNNGVDNKLTFTADIKEK